MYVMKLMTGENFCTCPAQFYIIWIPSRAAITDNAHAVAHELVLQAIVKIGGSSKRPPRPAAVD